MKSFDYNIGLHSNFAFEGIVQLVLENIYYNNDHPQNVLINISHEIFLASFHSTHTPIPQWGGTSRGIPQLGGTLRGTQ